MDPSSPLRIGILGAARIAPIALIRPARELAEAEVVAVAARSPEKAAKFASKHGVPRVHPSYEALLADPEIDAVYNPLPNGLHCEWTLAALEAGRHVLCEKPMASNADETLRMAVAAEKAGLVLDEAFHWRAHPLAARMREIIESGEIGELRHVEASLCIPFLLPGDIRYRLDLAGGATMDTGCYTVSVVRHLAGSEPEVRGARAKLSSPGVDRFMQAELDFGGGVSGRITCSLFSAKLLSVSASAEGTKGSLRVFNPIAPHLYHRLSVRGEQGSRSERVRGDATYTHQLRAFRVSTDAASVLTPTGSSPDGEVEDHQVMWDFPVSDFGDTPADGSTAPSGALTAYGNPEHRIDPLIHLGAGDPDDEATSINSAGADGDDTTDSDDENGLLLLSASQAGDLVDAAVQVTNTTGGPAVLCAWLDGYGDPQGIPNGSFDIANGQCRVIVDQSVDKLELLRFDSDLPNGVFTPLGDTYLRLRFTSDVSMTTASGNIGLIATGEVEDHFVAGSYDFGDAPAAVYGDASHALPKTSSETTGVQSFVFLGSLPSTGRPDAEPNSQADDNADGTAPIGVDESAVTFTAPAGGGETVIATVNTANLGTAPATVCAWLDRDGNGPFTAGDLADGGCQTVTGATPTREFRWAGLTRNNQVSTYARFRISTNAAEAGSPTGRARDGEVEDYPVTFDFQPTAVTLGEITASMATVDSILGAQGLGGNSTAGLYELLQRWIGDDSSSIDANDRGAITEALRSYLDPDGDGYVALLSWTTLEERGTVGFYAERLTNGGWERLNQQLLPAMIPAPLGAQYMLLDPKAGRGERLTYRLLELEARGTQREYGPFEIDLQ